ncbi:MAG TPA: hypothetical protein VF384_02275 [Planctomycetota bacterium]
MNRLLNLPLVSAFTLLGLASCQNPQPTAKSITVYPVVLADQPNAQAATVVGSLLERGGMPDVQVGEARFTPDAALDLAARSAAFTAFVKQQNLTTERALFVDVAGSPKTGIERLQAVLVDAGGKVLWSEQHRAGEPVFDEQKPKEPLDCCVFVVQRLREPLGLADPMRAGAKDGKLGASMKVDAGVPSGQEQRAIDARRAAFAKVAATTAIRVLPPRVGKDWPVAAAADLGKRLAAAGFAKATPATDPIVFETRTSSNEQAVLWSGVASLQKAVRAAAPGTDYLLATDFLMAGENKVGAVHCYLLAPNGDVVWVDYQNSHHDDFQRIAPKGTSGCAELAAIRAAKALLP